MKALRVLTAGVVLFASAGFLTAQTGGDAEKADKRADVVATLETAATLTAFGRGELEESGLKGHKSADALVAAAGILYRAEAATGGGLQVMNEKGEVVAGKKAASFKDQADALVIEAEAMVAGSKDKEKALAALVKAARSAESRGAVGGPRTISWTIPPGGQVTLQLPLVPNAKITISYSTAGGPKQRCEIVTPNGTAIYDNTGRTGSHSWKTGGAAATKPVTIRLTNTGTANHTVTVTTN